jgi:hypothetical protein
MHRKLLTGCGSAHEPEHPIPGTSAHRGDPVTEPPISRQQPQTLCSDRRGCGSPARRRHVPDRPRSLVGSVPSRVLPPAWLQQLRRRLSARRVAVRRRTQPRRGRALKRGRPACAGPSPLPPDPNGAGAAVSTQRHETGNRRTVRRPRHWLAPLHRSWLSGVSRSWRCPEADGLAKTSFLGAAPRVRHLTARSASLQRWRSGFGIYPPDPVAVN